MTDGVDIAVRVTPRSSRDIIEGLGDDGVLRVRVAAPPVDDAANRAVIKLLSAALRVPKSSIAIVAGASSRSKRVHIDGVGASSVRARWPGIESRENTR